jgi:hypothetical protein
MTSSTKRHAISDENRTYAITCLDEIGSGISNALEWLVLAVSSLDENSAKGAKDKAVSTAINCARDALDLGLYLAQVYDILKPTAAETASEAHGAP